MSIPTMKTDPVVRRTRSVCPVCLAPIPAALAEAQHAYSSLSVRFLPLTRRSAIHQWSLLHTVQFPEKRLLQYDCGKLQVLSASSSPL